MNGRGFRCVACGRRVHTKLFASGVRHPTQHLADGTRPGRRMRRWRLEGGGYQRGCPGWLQEAVAIQRDDPWEPSPYTKAAWNSLREPGGPLSVSGFVAANRPLKEGGNIDWPLGRLLTAAGYAELPITERRWPERIPLMPPGEDIRMTPLDIYLMCQPLTVMKPPVMMSRMVLPADPVRFYQSRIVIRNGSPFYEFSFNGLSVPLMEKLERWLKGSWRQRKRAMRIMRELRVSRPARPASFIIADEIDAYER